MDSCLILALDSVSVGSRRRTRLRDRIHRWLGLPPATQGAIELNDSEPARRFEIVNADALVDAEWESSADEIVGTVTMVFDHHASDLSEKLDSLQHAHFDKIVSAMHVHLDAHNCLEVLVIRGSSAQVRDIADGLLGTKGVKHGKLVTTTTGRHL